ncbi:MAG: type II secretion system protein [Snowella sp.]|nr:type II secretion system protein [Snowella sp.]
MIRTLFYLGFFRKKYLDNSSGLVCRNSGWTLLEVMIVILIIGILASLAIPNMMGAIEKRKAQSALFQIKGTLQEAQRNAIKMGKECKVAMNINVNPTYLTVEAGNQYIGCLSSAGLDLSEITVTENFPGKTIRFSYKGNTTNIGTIVVESPSAQTKYCLVVSNFLGIMRGGVYNGTTEGSISATNCQSSF